MNPCSAQDLVTLIAALTAGLVGVLGGIGVLYAKLNAYRDAVDGTQRELLDLTAKHARAEGVEAERQFRAERASRFWQAHDDANPPRQSVQEPPPYLP